MQQAIMRGARSLEAILGVKRIVSAVLSAANRRPTRERPSTSRRNQ